MAVAANTTVQAQLRPELGASLMEWDNEAAERGMVASLLMRPKAVPVQNGYVGVVSLEEMMKDSVVTDRASNGGYSRSDTKFTNFSFSTAEYGHEEVVSDRDARLYSMYLDAEIAAASRIRGILMRRLEKEVLDALGSTSTFANAGAGAVWTAAGTDVLTDVRTNMLAVRDACGMEPDTLVIGMKVFRALLQNTAIIERMKYWGGDDPKVGSMRANSGLLARALGIDRVVVAGMMRNSAEEGQSASLASIWDETKAGFYVTAKTDDIKEPCIGRNFIWTQDGANPDGSVLFESYREERERGNVIRGRHESGVKVFYAECGRILTAVSA